MANTVEILTRLVGARAVTVDLGQIQEALGATGKAGNDAAAGAKAAAKGTTDLEASLKILRREVANLVGLTALVKFFTEADREARAAARSMRAVATSLTILGQSTRAVGAQVTDTARRLEDLTGLAGTDFQRAFTVLARITQNAEESLSLMGLAADVAAGEQIALAQAAELVGRAAIGQTRQLQAMGLVLREGATRAEILAEIQRRYTGQAAAAVTAVDHLRVAWDRFQETVGTRVQPKLDALFEILTKMLAVAEKLAETAIFDLGAPRVTVRPNMAPGVRGQAEAIQELDREMARASAMTTLLRRTSNEFLEVERAFDQAMRSTAEHFLLFNDEQARLQAELSASQTLLKAYIDGGLTSLDDRVRRAAANVDGLTVALERLALAVESAGRQTGAEQSARLQAQQMQAAAEATERAQVALDAFHVADAERQLEALALANQHVADEADRAAAALERVAGAMTLSESTARANNRQVERTSQVLSDAEKAMARWTGVTLENLLTVEDASQVLWASFEFGAADAFAAILVDGESFARKFKDLLRTLASDVLRLFARMGLQRGLFGAFVSGTAGTAGVVEGGVPVQGVGAAGAGAVTGAGAGAAVGFGLPVAALGAQFLFDLGTKLGGGTKAAQIGSGAGGALFGLVTGGAAFLGGGLVGGLVGGSKGRRERRRTSQQQQAVQDLMNLGIDQGTAEAIVAQQEASRGAFGTGGAFFELKDLIDVASGAGLRGETAARGLGFVSNFAANRETALGEIGDVSGGLAGFGPQAAETVDILTKGAGETLKHWEEVDAFFQRFTETLEAVQATLEAGFTDAFARAAEAVLRGGGALESLREGIRIAIEQAIIQGFVGGVLIEELIAPYIARFRDAVLKGTEDPRAVIVDLAAQIPQWAALVESILGPIAPVLDQIYKPPAAALPLGVTATGFAHGGIVTAPTLAVIGEAGPEAVVPLSGRGGGMTLELHDTITVDGDVLARVVRRRLPSQVRLGDFAGR